MISKDKLANLFSFGYIAFFALFLVLQLAHLLVDALAGTLSFYANNKQFFVSDFVHFYVMAKMALSSQSHEAYNLVVQRQFFYQVVNPPKADEQFCTQYMPFLYPMVIPLVLFPVHIAHFICCFASLALGFIALTILLKSINVSQPKTIAAVLCAAGASMPSMITLYFGQISWFLLFFVALYVCFWLKKRDYLAGIFLALTTIKPQYSLMLAIPALAEKRLKLLSVALLSEVVLLFFAGMTIGFHDVVFYPAILFALETKFPIAAERMVSLRGLLSAIMPQAIAVPVSLLIMIVALIALFIFCWRAGNQSQKLKRWTIALTILISLIVSPHTFIYDCVLLACVAALTIFDDTDVRSGVPAFSAWRIIFVSYPIFSWAIFVVAPGVWQNYCFCLVNIILFVLGWNCLSCFCRTEAKSM